MPSKRSLNMTIWLRWQRPMKGPAKNTRYTSKLTLWQPPVTTPILKCKLMLCQSFQKDPPKKVCGKCGCSHSHGDCPAHSTTCSKCGHLNHWAQQCRSSGRRNSSTSCSPSLGRPQNRERRFSGNKPNKGREHGGGGGKQKSGWTTSGVGYVFAVSCPVFFLAWSAVINLPNIGVYLPL